MGGLAKLGVAFGLGVVATLILVPRETPPRSDRREESAIAPPSERPEGAAKAGSVTARRVTETSPEQATLDALAWLQRRLPRKFDTLTVAQLRHLRELDLSGVRVTAEDLALLKNLPSLAILDLRNTGITDTELALLGELESLERLTLLGTAITDNGLTHLRHLRQLKELNASLIMTDAGLPYLKELTSLRRLGLYSCRDITDAGLVNLQELEGLEFLQLQFTKMTDAGLEYLEDLPALRFLDVRGTGVTPGRADAFRQAHPDCRLLK